MIPVSVIVMTKNEADNLPRSLPPLVQNFDEVFVVDSNSTDDTVAIAKKCGAVVANFIWNGKYPKKKQWCMDHLPLKHDWIFLCDADEIVSDDFITECQSLDFSKDGYFVSSKMIWSDTQLNHGQQNNKLCLLNKNAFVHPVVDDLNIDGGWEVEGHYQPIARKDKSKIGQIKSPLYHTDIADHWVKRHKKYIAWEIEMIKRDAFPKDPVVWREKLKRWTRSSFFRPYIYFLYAYILKGGVLDGRAGLDYALHRRWYNRRIIDGIARDL